MTTKDNGKNKKINDNTFGLFLQDFAIGFAGIIVFIIFGSTGLFLSKVAQVISQDNNNFTGNNFSITKTVNSSINNKLTITSKGGGPITSKGGGPKPITMNTKHLLGMNGLAFWEIFFNEPIKFEQRAMFVDKDLINNSNSNSNNENIFKDIASNSFEDTMKKGINGIKNTFNLMSGLNESVTIFLCGMFGLILIPIFFIYNFIWSFAFVIKSVADSLVNESFSFFKGTSLDTSKDNNENIFKKILMALWLFLPRAFYIFTFFVFIIIILFVLPFYTMFQSIWKLLTSNYKLDTSSENDKPNTCGHIVTISGTKKVYTLGTFIVDVLFNKKIVWLLVILNLFTCTNTWFGDVGIMSAIAAVIVMIIWPGILKPCVTIDDNTMITKFPINNLPFQSASFLIKKYNAINKDTDGFEKLQRLCKNDSDIVLKAVKESCE